MPQDIRWKQRFQNFDRAVTLLREAFARGAEVLSDLEKEGAVHRFEFALELGWKTLRDYLEHEGAVVAPVTPRNVIKEAHAARILPEGQIWIDMLNHRNLLSHTYDRDTFEEVVKAIQQRYLLALTELRAWFQQRSM